MDETPVLIRWSAADAIDEETNKAFMSLLKRYGSDYARGWLAGRQQAAEEIRAL